LIVALTSNVSPTAGVVGVCVAFETNTEEDVEVDCAATGLTATRPLDRQSAARTTRTLGEGRVGDICFG
jgi:hypothetical protein